MGLHDEFASAVKAIDGIDFTTCSLDEINVFETTIRYLGGFLAAFDLSGDPVLVKKAVEMGTMLYKAFDTPNRMPITRWKFRDAFEGTKRQESSENMLVAEIGSLTLEFTRLSQISGDPKYYDAVQRIMDVFEEQQDKTKLPGMWPVVVNAKTGDFTGYDGFTIGGMADSTFEYLPKQHMLLGAGIDQYHKLYTKALAAMKRNIFFRPMVQDADILFAGSTVSDGKTPVDQLHTNPEAQHLGCFAGGMVGIGAKLFPEHSESDMSTAKKLVEGCLWAYENMPQGVMAEKFELLPCADDKCQWDEDKWVSTVKDMHSGDESVQKKIKANGLVRGVTKVSDKRYILR
jgi:mannosyl-oligosaccharide alpha-1,2-mannosidase